MKVTIEELPENLEIVESYLVANSKLNRYQPNEIMYSISGGADSDVLMHLAFNVADNEGGHFVFFDTGLEYQATKDHLAFLENKYGITIEKVKPKVPIPLACRKYGQPFLSKQVSEWISRLQRHGFKWEDEDFETLLVRYPKCRAALKWWCNEWALGKASRFNISYNKLLKEFMAANPPDFKISSLCCKCAKKDPAVQYKQENKIALSCIGIRKSEGGARATFRNCFTPKQDAADEYRPLFWYKSDTRKVYEEFFDITHSRCYSEYGLKRTGCAGCPFGKDFEFELDVIERYEPKLFKAVNTIFKDSYEYTRKYKEFVKNHA